MSKRLLFSVLICTCALAGSGPTVPVELVGRWATTPAACAGKGANVLVINDAGIERGQMHGHIVAGSAPDNPAIEVHFRSPTGGATARNVRTYRLSTDRGTLLELSGTRLVATWTLCESNTQ